MSTDPSRIPVIAGVGQAIEREAIVDALDLAERAGRAALAGARGAEVRIERVSFVRVSFSAVDASPASAVGKRLGLENAHAELTTAGGQAPQWLVNRAAREIAAGELSATLLLGAEATRSMRAAARGKDWMEVATKNAGIEWQDPEVGIPMKGTMSRAEYTAGMGAPAEVYPIFENARAARAGRSYAQQREQLGPLVASMSEVAAAHPYAWFREARSADELADPSGENRIIAEPYTRAMNAFPNVDQGAAVLVTSLAVARELGLEPLAFPWSGAELQELRPIERPDLSTSPALIGAARAALDAAGVAADEIAHVDFYSCFPIAVEVGCEALGMRLDDPRGVTVTGGLPFFGGPGNEYSLHAIATIAERVKERGGLAFVNANGGLLSKHAAGVYGAEPPAHGFRVADTSAVQERLRAQALPYELVAEGSARVEAATVVYGRDGVPVRAPVIATLEDGRRVAARPTEARLPDLAGENLVGRKVRVAGEPLVYDL